MVASFVGSPVAFGFGLVLVLVLEAEAEAEAALVLGADGFALVFVAAFVGVRAGVASGFVAVGSAVAALALAEDGGSALALSDSDALGVFAMSAVVPGLAERGEAEADAG